MLIDRSDQCPRESLQSVIVILAVTTLKRPICEREPKLKSDKAEKGKENQSQCIPHAKPKKIKDSDPVCDLRDEHDTHDECE